MTSTTGTQGHTAIAPWPQLPWTRIGRALADQIATTRTSLAASRAYTDARSDAGRRQAMADFLQTIR